VADQGQTNSCVGNAVAAVIEQLDNKDGEHTDASRLFIYWNARKLAGIEDRDMGCHIRDAIKSTVSTGVASTETWPFVSGFVNREPSREAYVDAEKKKVGAYYRIGSNRLYELKYALGSGYPVVFGIMVYPSLYKAGKTGVIPIPAPGEKRLGGHAIKAVGYDDDFEGGCVIFQNSWGTGWGDKGFGYLPYKFIEDEYLSDDYWVITKGGFIDGAVQRCPWYSRAWRYLRYFFGR
jgi:C1A family cysteine protease